MKQMPERIALRGDQSYFALAPDEAPAKRETEYIRADIAAATKANMGKAVERYEWQPIETAPKEMEFRCLVAHYYSVVTAYWDGNGWINERSRFRSYFWATHWMPLPGPPSESNEVDA